MVNNIVSSHIIYFLQRERESKNEGYDGWGCEKNVKYIKTKKYLIDPCSRCSHCHCHNNNSSKPLKIVQVSRFFLYKCMIYL